MLSIGNQPDPNGGWYGEYDKWIPLYVVQNGLYEASRYRSNNTSTGIYKYISESFLKWDYPTRTYLDELNEVVKEKWLNKRTGYRPEEWINSPLTFTHPSRVDVHYSRLRRIRKTDCKKAIEGKYYSGYVNKTGGGHQYYNTMFHSTFGGGKLDVHFSLMIDVRYYKVYRAGLLAGESLPRECFKLYIDRQYLRNIKKSTIGKWLDQKLWDNEYDVMVYDNLTSVLFAKTLVPRFKNLKEYKSWIEETHVNFIEAL